MTRNTKKIEKLEAKVAEINEKMKADIELKTQLEKQIDELKNAEILAFIKTKKIAVNDTFLANLELVAKINKSGVQSSDIEDLLKISASENNEEDKNDD